MRNSQRMNRHGPVHAIRALEAQYPYVLCPKASTGLACRSLDTLSVPKSPDDPFASGCETLMTRIRPRGKLESRSLVSMHELVEFLCPSPRIASLGLNVQPKTYANAISSVQRWGQNRQIWNPAGTGKKSDPG